jgi:hypothetical protein
MSVHAVGGQAAANAYFNAAEQVSGTQGRIALLMLEAQQDDEQLAQQQQELARASYELALDREVSEMHDAADAAWLGAVVQGSIAVAAGALSVAGALNREVPELGEKPCDALKLRFNEALEQTDIEIAGGALQAVAAPIGKLAGAQEGHHSANAKAQSGQQEMARWALNDANDDIDQSRELAQKALDWVDSRLDNDATAIDVVLANLA